MTVFLILALPVTALAADMLILEPSKDNTLYETAIDQNDQQFELSNGAGSFLFVGRTGLDAGFKLRRTLMKFDLSANLPADIELVFAELSMYQSKAAPGSPPVDLGLHRVLQEWGESSSNAVGPEGQGALAEPGDATWHHRLFPADTWNEAGGSYKDTASAVTAIGQIQQNYIWSCNSALLEDLRTWHNSPELNFGWELVGGEAGGTSAHRFNSREHSAPEQRPQLTIVYRKKESVFGDGFEDDFNCP